MSEVRRVHVRSMACDLEEWLATLPGRLFSLMPHPRNQAVWLAVTVEDQ